MGPSTGISLLVLFNCLSLSLGLAQVIGAPAHDCMIPLATATGGAVFFRSCEVPAYLPYEYLRWTPASNFCSGYLAISCTSSQAKMTVVVDQWDQGNATNLGAQAAYQAVPDQVPAGLVSPLSCLNTTECAKQGHMVSTNQTIPSVDVYLVKDKFDVTGSQVINLTVGELLSLVCGPAISDKITNASLFRQRDNFGSPEASEYTARAKFGAICTGYTAVSFNPGTCRQSFRVCRVPHWPDISSCLGFPLRAWTLNSRRAIHPTRVSTTSSSAKSSASGPTCSSSASGHSCSTVQQQHNSHRSRRSRTGGGCGGCCRILHCVAAEVAAPGGKRSRLTGPLQSNALLTTLQRHEAGGMAALSCTLTVQLPPPLAETKPSYEDFDRGKTFWPLLLPLLLQLPCTQYPA